jgi:hypothetical protein
VGPSRTPDDKKTRTHRPARLGLLSAACGVALLSWPALARGDDGLAVVETRDERELPIELPGEEGVASETDVLETPEEVDLGIPADDGSEDTAAEGTPYAPPVVSHGISIASRRSASEGFLGPKPATSTSDVAAPTPRQPRVFSSLNDEIHDVPYETLVNARNRFRSMLGSGALGHFGIDERYVGSLLSPFSPNDPIIPNAAGEGLSVLAQVGLPDDTDVDPVSLDAEKVYTVVDGKIVEVAKVDPAPLPERAPVRPPEGFVIEVVEEGETKRVTSEGIVAVASPVSSPSVFQAPPSDDLNASLVNIENSASQRRFEIPSELQSTEGLALISKATSDEAAPVRYVSVRGRVAVPRGMQASNVVLRIAGTGWQIQPEADGLFEFRDMPLGSRFEIVAWDVDGRLARRIVPVTVAAGGIVDIELQKTSFVDDLSASFGLRQTLDASGFCAELAASNRDILIGARVTLTAPREWQGPFYFNDRRLPDANLAEATRSGKFCVFNAQSDIVDVNVHLMNGTRRSFTVHLKPSTFETGLAFDMTTSVYRAAMPLELVDSFAAFDSSANEQKLRFGTLSTRRWLSGEESASWSRVYGLRISTDKAYAPQAFEEANENGAVYFPLGQEWQEIHVRRDEEGAPSSFSIVSRDELLTARIRNKMEASKDAPAAYSDSSEAFVVRAMDPDTLEDVRRAMPSFDADPSKGVVFLSLDLAGLEVDYSDLRLSLRDAWTGQSVAPFHFLPLAPGVKKARTLRGFFTDIPEGQFTLLVSDVKGALKWIDVVRSRAGALQLISTRE